jgi:putative intracellular protease/amidase
VDIKRIVEAMNVRRALIAGVCHGVLGLLSAEAEDGLTLLKGRKATGISNAEDELAGVAQIVPLLPEDHLKKAGAIYVAAAPFAANVVSDGHVLTGQNPASALPLAQAIVRRLKMASAA